MPRDLVTSLVSSLCHNNTVITNASNKRLTHQNDILHWLNPHVALRSFSEVNSGIFPFLFHLLPKTKSSRNELESSGFVYGDDVGVYLFTFLTWTTLIAKVEPLMVVITLQIISSDGKDWTSHRFHTDYFITEYFFFLYAFI